MCLTETQLREHGPIRMLIAECVKCGCAEPAHCNSDDPVWEGDRAHVCPNDESHGHMRVREYWPKEIRDVAQELLDALTAIGGGEEDLLVRAGRVLGDPRTES